MTEQIGGNHEGQKQIQQFAEALNIRCQTKKLYAGKRTAV
jgi:hypothetical protein